MQKKLAKCYMSTLRWFSFERVYLRVCVCVCDSICVCCIDHSPLFYYSFWTQTDRGSPIQNGMDADKNWHLNTFIGECDPSEMVLIGKFMALL